MTTQNTKTLYLLQLYEDVPNLDLPTFEEMMVEIFKRDPVLAKAIDEGVLPVRCLSIICKDDTPNPTPLPDLDDCLGLILSGSPCNIEDYGEEDRAWMNKMVPYIRKAYLARVPTFGICFGHQLIAHSLGGVVGRLPRVNEQEPDHIFEIGTRAVQLLKNAEQDLVFGDIYKTATNTPVDSKFFHVSAKQPTPLPMIQTKWKNIDNAPSILTQISHGFGVTELPSNTHVAEYATYASDAHQNTSAAHTTFYPRIPTKDVDESLVQPNDVSLATFAKYPHSNIINQPIYVLSYNHIEPHHALAYGNNFYSTQFHPEMNVPVVRFLMRMKEPNIHKAQHIIGSYDEIYNDYPEETYEAARLLIQFAKTTVNLANDLHLEQLAVENTATSA